MANEEHVKIIGQGVEVWNAWRNANMQAQPDLAFAILEGVRLDDIHLYDSDLQGVNMLGAELGGAIFKWSRLAGARLQYADLEGADFLEANLAGAILNSARLHGAKFHGTDLTGCNLRNARLFGATFGKADLRDADLSGVHLGGSIFAGVDLGTVRGLADGHHFHPSVVDHLTLARSRGRIPEEFLRGCGFSDWEIEAAKLHNPHLTAEAVIDITYEVSRLKAESPIQIDPLFISYSHADAPFIELLEKRLDEKRVRYWRDVHDMKAGRMETQIDRAVRHNPILLLVLSKRSVESDWVEWEVSKARELEKELKRDVLCPVALDKAWKGCSWEGPLQRQVEKYHILDFSEWQDAEVFEKQFARLIDGLGVFYPKASGEYSHGQPEAT